MGVVVALATLVAIALLTKALGGGMGPFELVVGLCLAVLAGVPAWRRYSRSRRDVVTRS